MPDESAKPKGLKKIASSEHQLLTETKEKKPTRILECPSELGPVARQEWDRLVGQLTSKGVLSSSDRGPLAAYCTAFALAMEAAEMVHKHGAMIKSPNGFPMQSPYLSHLNRQIEIMMRIASEFGFTPASRSRIFSFDQKNSLLLDDVGETDSDNLNWGEAPSLSLNVKKKRAAAGHRPKKV
jgi:P27 family predicted phage terminase small subunit